MVLRTFWKNMRLLASGGVTKSTRCHVSFAMAILGQRENILQHSRFGPCLILRFLCSLLSLTSLLRYLLQASPCARSLPTFRKEPLQMGRGGGGVWYPDLLWHSLESCVVASKNPSFLLLMEFMEGYIQMSRGARKLGSGMLRIYPAQLNGIV